MFLGIDMQLSPPWGKKQDKTGMDVGKASEKVERYWVGEPDRIRSVRSWG